MANLRIQIIGTNVEFVDKGNGKGYNKLTVTYKDLTPKPGATGSKVDVKTIMDFASPEVFNTLKNSKTNDLFQVTSEKVNNFWTWTEVHRDDGAVPEAPPAAVGANTQVYVGGQKVNTYEQNNLINKERLEFDKQKQPLIIRQSSLSTAVDYLKAQGGKFQVSEVINVAKQFEDYVNSNTIGQMADDIPE